MNQLYKATRSYDRYYASILIRGFESSGVKFLSFTETALLDDIYPVVKHVAFYGDVFDEQHGRDLIVSRTAYQANIKRQWLIVEPLPMESPTMKKGRMPTIPDILSGYLERTTSGYVQSIVRRLVKPDGTIDLMQKTKPQAQQRKLVLTKPYTR